MEGLEIPQATCAPMHWSSKCWAAVEINSSDLHLLPLAVRHGKCNGSGPVIGSAGALAGACAQLDMLPRLPHVLARLPTLGLLLLL